MKLDFLKRISRLYWVALVFLLATAAVIYWGLHSNQHSAIEAALLEGQRIEIDLTDGEIYGQTSSPVAQQEESNQDQKIAEQAPPETEHAPKEAPAATKTSEATGTETNAPEPMQPSNEPTSEDATENVTTTNKTPVVQSEVEEPSTQVEKAPTQKAPIADEEPLEETNDTDTFIAAAETVQPAAISDLPAVVIIMKGLGLSASTTEAALQLPTEVTFGFSPYAPSLVRWSKIAHQQGREFLLQVPMETYDTRTNNPGPYALMSASPKEDNITRLKMLLSLTNNYEGIYSDQNEKFSHNIASIRPILKELKKMGVYYVYGNGYSNHTMIQTADDIDYPMLISDMVIDSDISVEGINDGIKKMVNLAKRKGYVVAMAHPYPMTIRILEQWLPDASEQGVRVMPVSALLGKNIVRAKDSSSQNMPEKGSPSSENEAATELPVLESVPTEASELPLVRTPEATPAVPENTPRAKEPEEKLTETPDVEEATPAPVEAGATPKEESSETPKVEEIEETVEAPSEAGVKKETTPPTTKEINETQ